ncbi:hypothetical protein TNCV_918471 [Trichonephila clavipes]|nr:hypothetical protein TNCV_918471 [Trichonephila clavipes]
MIENWVASSESLRTTVVGQTSCRKRPANDYVVNEMAEEHLFHTTGLRAKKGFKNAASQELNISSSIITETTPKTPAERSRDYRARKRQKSEENQESNDLTRITVEVEVHQEQDNSQPSTSTLPIKRKKLQQNVFVSLEQEKNH